MPSNSYLTILVLALAASTVSPVRCGEPRQIEDQRHTLSAPVSQSQHHTSGTGNSGKARLSLGDYVGRFSAPIGGLTFIILTYALGGHLVGFRRATRAIPPTKTTQPTSPSQPNNPPRAFVRREERDLGRGLPMDTSNARSIKNRDGRTSSSLDLLSRADLREALILFKRMLDELD